MKPGQKYWLIGASEGLGRALAEALAERGLSLVLSARNATRLRELANALPGAHEVVPLDVTDAASVAAAAENLPELDGVIYLAGAYEPMPAGEFDGEVAAKVAEVNLIGAIRTLGLVVPDMAARGRGHVVLIGSLAGFRGLPGAIGYGAGKAGLMHLGENLRADLWRTKVKVQVINPGFIRTQLTNKNDFDMPQLMEPEEAASHVWRAMESQRFSTSFPAPFAWLFRVGRWLPDWLFLRLFANQRRLR